MGNTLATMPQNQLAQQVKQHGGPQQYREYVANNLQDQQLAAKLNRWYRGKQQALKAALQAENTAKNIADQQQEYNTIYKQFAAVMEKRENQLAQKAVAMLAACYKKTFCLNNTRNLMLDMAKGLCQKQLADAIDSQYGKGCAAYIASAIKQYYGV